MVVGENGIRGVGGGTVGAWWCGGCGGDIGNMVSAVVVWRWPDWEWNSIRRGVRLVLGGVVVVGVTLVVDGALERCCGGRGGNMRGA